MGSRGSCQNSSTFHRFIFVMKCGVLGLFGVAGCARSQDDDGNEFFGKMNNGANVGQYDDPSVVEIRYRGDKPGQFNTCTGALINQNGPKILTAGHCGINETNGMPHNPADMRVNVNGQIIQPSQVGVHPMYNGKSNNANYDLALLSLPSNPTLPNGRDLGAGKIGDAVNIDGFGKQTLAAMDPPGTRRRGSNTIMGNANGLIYLTPSGQGTPFYRPMFGDMPDSTRFDPYHTQISGGDSGGPLIDQRTGKIVGVASKSNWVDDPRNPENRNMVRGSTYVDVNSPCNLAYIQGKPIPPNCR